MLSAEDLDTIDGVFFAEAGNMTLALLTLRVCIRCFTVFSWCIAAAMLDWRHVVNRHRAEIDNNFQVAARTIAAQNARLTRALEIQKRWNYALTAAVAILAITLAVILYKMGVR